MFIGLRSVKILHLRIVQEDTGARRLIKIVRTNKIKLINALGLRL